MDFERKFRAANRQLDRFSSKVDSTGKAMAGVGRKLTTRLTLPIVAGLGMGVRSFVRFDKAMTESLAIFNDVTDEMRAQMSRTAIDLSTKTTFAAHELAAAYFALGSAGFDAAGSMKLLGPSARFAQAGAFDLTKGVRGLTGTMAALGLKTGDANKDLETAWMLADKLVGANTLADATTEQFGEAMTRAGGIIKAYNLGIDESIAVIAALAEIQKKAEVGGEQLSRILRILVPTAGENAKAYEALGVRVFDANENLRNFKDILRDLEDTLGKMTPRAKGAALEMLGFQRRMQGAILPIIGMSDRVEEFQERLAKMGGTTDRVANKQLRALGNRLTITRNRMDNASRTMGQSLIPSIERLSLWVNKQIDRWDALSDSQKSFRVNMALAVAAIGPALSILGNLVRVLGAVWKWGNKLILLGIKNPAFGLGALALIGGAAIGTMLRKIPMLERGWDRFAVKVMKTVGAFEELNRELDPAGAAAARANAARWEQDRLNRAVQEAAATQKRLEEQSITDAVRRAEKKITAAQLPFIPGDEDIDAQMAFQKRLEDAVVDRLKLSEKITVLAERRAKLEEQITKAQKDSAAFFELRSRALETEKDILESIEEARDKFIEAQKLSPAALEKGGLGAYRATIQANKREQFQKETNKKLGELIDIGKRQTTLLGDAVRERTGEELVVVNIL